MGRDTAVLGMHRQLSAEHQSAAPEVQLRFLFDQYDIDKQALTEKKAELNEIVKSVRGYKKAAEEKQAADEKIRTIKAKVETDNHALIVDIENLSAAVKSQEASMSSLAADTFRKKGKVEFEAADGRIITGEMRFKFKNAATPKDDDDAEGEE